MNIQGYIFLGVAKLYGLLTGHRNCPVASLFLHNNITEATYQNKYAPYKKMVHHLAKKGHIPEPRLFIKKNSYPNAYSFWSMKSHYFIGMNTGEIKNHSDGEIEYVLGHELGHYYARQNIHFLDRLVNIGFCLSLANLIIALFSQVLSFIVMIIMLAIVIFLFSYIPIYNIKNRRSELKADVIGAKLSSPQFAIDSLLHDYKFIKDTIDPDLEMNSISPGDSHPSFGQRIQNIKQHFPHYKDDAMDVNHQNNQSSNDTSQQTNYLTK